MPTSSELFGGGESVTTTTPARSFLDSAPAPRTLPSSIERFEDQPYASPPISSESYRSTTPTNYASPGWGLFSVSLLNLGYDFLWMGIIVIAMFTEKLDADAVIGFGMFLGWGLLSIGLHATTLIAGLRMTQRRSLSIARFGSILGLVPCGICSVIQIPFAIWALVAVYSADAPKDFTD